VIWRAAGVATGAALLAVAFAVSASAAVPEGARLAFLHVEKKPFTIEIASSSPDGEQVERLIGGGAKERPLPNPFVPIEWLPDGSALAFNGIVGPLHDALASNREAIFISRLDGGVPQELPGTRGLGAPVFSPDGQSMAYTRYKGGGDETFVSPDGETRHLFLRTSIWLSRLDGTASRRLTPWRTAKIDSPASFSPDGSILAITRNNLDGHMDARAIRIDGSGSRLIAKEASQPIYSPDGTRIALLRRRQIAVHGRTRGEGRSARFVTTTDLYVVKADGSGAKRLTRTRAIDESPAWDPSGLRLAYLTLHGRGIEALLLGFGDSVNEINADGSCPTRVLTAASDEAFLSPVWRPGAGREAGPISC